MMIIDQCSSSRVVALAWGFSESPVPPPAAPPPPLLPLEANDFSQSTRGSWTNVSRILKIVSR